MFQKQSNSVLAFPLCSAYTLRGHSKTTMTRYWPFLTNPPPACVDNFYGINVDKKRTFLDHLPTSSCKRSLWTTLNYGSTRLSTPMKPFFGRKLSIEMPDLWARLLSFVHTGAKKPQLPLITYFFCVRSHGSYDFCKKLTQISDLKFVYFEKAIQFQKLSQF